MNKYLISYDLNSPGKDYAKLIEAIKAYPWAVICKSAWAIKSNNSNADLATEFWKHMDSNDKLFVSEITGWAANNLPATVIKWLRDN